MSDPLSSASSPRERELFLGALEKTPEERTAFLHASCADDPELQQRVEGLLQEQAAMDSFLETPAVASAGPGDTEIISPLTEKPGDRIGRYKLLQQIGEGGCGAVYMAEQEEPVRRRVALKVIKLGMDTKSVIARFEAERQALAMMDHPNIARVFDAGATETGRPYFVMELVRGIRITEFCDENQLSNEERLRLFVQVCQAIQHAHQKGIIHRDVKPSNILVTLHDGRPVPKVIDFGIAKATEQRLTDKTLFTEFQSFIGTPAYTSPEQAEMSGLDIDTRSDIYSLGVLLYELLTGRPPFDPNRLLQSGLHEMRRIIREEEPVRPSTRLNTLGLPEATALTRTRRAKLAMLVENVRGDLDWIVMKCLEKDRSRRYETANALAMDVQRYLDDEPVLARPPSATYRLQKFVHRNKGTVTAAAAIAAALLLGVVVSSWQAIRATQAEREQSFLRKAAEAAQHNEANQRSLAEQEKASARLNEYVADINLAQQSLNDGNYGRAFQLLEKHRSQAGEPDLRGFEWRYLWQRCQGDEHVNLPNQAGQVESVSCSPDGQLLAVGLRDGVNIWSTRSRTLITNLTGFVNSPAFLPNGETLLTDGPGGIRSWQVGDWKQMSLPWSNSGFEPGRAFGRGPRPRRGPGPGFRGRGRGPDLEHGPGFGPGFGPDGCLVLSRDGSVVATLDREGIIIRDTQDGKVIRRLSGAAAPMAFSPDGTKLAADSESGITVWPLEGAASSVVLEDSTNVFVRGGGPRFTSDRTMIFSPDGKSVVAARNTLSRRGVFVLSVWDATSGKEVAVMPEDPEHIEHTGIITCLAFSPDGNTLATASMDHSIRLWDFKARKKLDVLQGHLSEVIAVAFSPDGKWLASGARDGGVKLWPIPQQRKEDVLQVPWHPLAFSPDGQTLAALTETNSVVFVNVASGEVESQLALNSIRPRFGGPGFRGPPRVAASDDLGTIAQGLEDGRVKLWNAAAGDSRILRVSNRPLAFVALSPQGDTLVAGSRGQPLQCWDLPRNTHMVLPTEARQVMFSPDGTTLAVFPGLEQGPPGFPGRFRPGSQSANQSTNIIQLWDLSTASLHTNLVIGTMPMQPGVAAAFSPDGRQLATVNFDVIELWSVATGTLLGTFTGHKQAVQAIAFSADGKTLASASDDSTLKFWNVATQQELLTIRRLGGSVSDLLFSPDGRLLIGAGGFRAQAQGLRFYCAPQFSEIGDSGIKIGLND